MTPLKLFVALSALSAASHAMAWDYVLLDTDKAAQNWQITSQQLGITTDKPFSVTLRTLHGGRQEGPLSVRGRRPNAVDVPASLGPCRHGTTCIRVVFACRTVELLSD